MKDSLRKVWIELAFQQACSHRLVNAVITKNLDACWPLGPQVRGDSGRSRSDDVLNPMEFHGKRQAEWPPQAPSGQRCQ